MELVGDHGNSGQLLVFDLGAERVGAGIALSPYLQPCAGGGGADQVDDHLVVGERPPSPVHGDVTEEPVLDFVPLRGTRRKATHRDVKAGSGGQLAQLDFPQPAAVAVGASGIGGYQQTGGFGGGETTLPVPPPAHGGNRDSRGGIVVSRPH